LKLLLKGGRIIDPSQTIDMIGDLLIAEGRIVAIGGSLDDADAVVIDAQGLVVAPAHRQPPQAGLPLSPVCPILTRLWTIP